SLPPQTRKWVPPFTAATAASWRQASRPKDRVLKQAGASAQALVACKARKAIVRIRLRIGVPFVLVPLAALVGRPADVVANERPDCNRRAAGIPSPSRVSGLSPAPGRYQNGGAGTLLARS